MPFSEAKRQGVAVREHERGVPFLFYNWNQYVNRNNPKDIISRNDYQALDAEQQKQYKGVHNREIRTLFCIDQTTMPFANEKEYKKLLADYGTAEERGLGEGDERAMHVRFNDFLLKMRENLVPIRTDGSGVAHYDTERMQCICHAKRTLSITMTMCKKHCARLSLPQDISSGWHVKAW